MSRKKPVEILRNILIGKRYYRLTQIDEQLRYVAMNSIFVLATFPLVILGYTMIAFDFTRAIFNFFMAFICLSSVILLRTNVSLNKVPLIPVSMFGLYCIFLVHQGDYNLWGAIWFLAFPMISILLCGSVIGITQSVIVLLSSFILLNVPFSPVDVPTTVQSRFIFAFLLLFGLTIIFERIRILKGKKEAALSTELAQEKELIEAMKDNIHQGIFLMDSNLKILPQYSKPLITILSYYDSELAGHSLLDILAASLDTSQLQVMKGYFSMVFEKKLIKEVLEEANPISEFEYKIDGRTKFLSTRFHLIEQEGAQPVIVGVVQDITREKEFENELKTQRDAQQEELKNMFDVIQIDPLVFQDFIEDTESNFNYINTILKDRSLTEKQVVTKFFQNVHAMKSNAFALKLESFGKKLHVLEDSIKAVMKVDKINVEDILGLAIELETLMKEKDAYEKTRAKIDSYRTSNQADSVLTYNLRRAAENAAAETGKKVELKVGQMNMEILESNLRKPIKDILFQCVRNSIYHGIETEEERVRKNKKPQGLLTINIKNNDGKAEITFSDDGQGLNWQKIKAAYLKNNPKAKTITKKMLLSSIFSPEFSTADETSTVAGRGVGLSLVKDITKNNGGAISVDSSESGLTLRFTFPMPTK